MTKKQIEIWIECVDATGCKTDYTVIGWKAAEIEAISILMNGFRFCQYEDRNRMEKLIFDGKWQEAVSMYNECNDLKEKIYLREGTKEYKPLG